MVIPPLGPAAGGLVAGCWAARDAPCDTGTAVPHGDTARVSRVCPCSGAGLQCSLWWHFSIETLKYSEVGHLSISEGWVTIQGLEFVILKSATCFYLLALICYYYF